MFKDKIFWYGAGGAVAFIGIAVLSGALVAGWRPSTNKIIKGADAETPSNVTVVPDGGFEIASYAEAVIPSAGVKLPVKWGDLGKKMTDAGVIDKAEFLAIYQERGGLSPADLRLLEEGGNGEIIINESNAGYLLNLLWALGLANKNPILEEGPMTDSQYGGADRFASTGGWTLAKGDPMQYYSKYKWVVLSADQQKKVDNVSQGIFRPCCNNSTYFPDCNHGMAMLALLELMAANGASENEMFAVALKVNSYWFTDTYMTMAKYYKEKRGLDWSEVDPREALSFEFSSASGYRQIKSQIAPVQSSGGAGCGV